MTLYAVMLEYPYECQYIDSIWLNLEAAQRRVRRRCAATNRYLKRSGYDMRRYKMKMDHPSYARGRDYDFSVEELRVNEPVLNDTSLHAMLNEAIDVQARDVVTPNTFTIPVNKCARCGMDHMGVKFQPLGEVRSDGFTHFGPCPNHKGNILLKIVEGEEDA